jgi:hypothetical protein
MENMLPGNSFPQICVVSVNECVEKAGLSQEHVGIVAKSNRHVYLLSNRTIFPIKSLF